ncbi:hypothetical protein BASA81_000844 [Batrachochytrium salamandrivorans]|nr:hypothetical protein BASA81_000844 [Batrachochytrium salamandrivorans]
MNAARLAARLDELRLEVATKQATLARLSKPAVVVVEPTKGPVRFRGRKTETGQVVTSKRRADFEMPRDLVENAELDDAIARTLPANYNFEIKKSLWRIRRSGAKKVAIQFPEALGCELLIHYGHSCLVPIDTTPSTGVQMMYVFVDVSFDVEHMVESIKLEFPFPELTKLAVLGTIQFSSTLANCKTLLDQYFTVPVIVPQAKPLSGGEVLGCTSPILPVGIDAFVFVADGRFHLESCMIANPTLPAFRYDPFSKVLTREAYAFDELLTTRRLAIDRAAGTVARKCGVVLGTLGRQGNPKILTRVLAKLTEKHWDTMVVLLSELSPAKLKKMESEVQVWVQIACPRLSMDWAEAFSTRPLLTPYELFVMLDDAEWTGTSYPQDFYSKGGGKWTNYYEQ